MDIRPLSDVELRDALGPLNRGAGGGPGIGAAGQLGKVVRTPAQLRERAAAEVLDLKLSRVLLLGGDKSAPSGAALVERVGESAHIEALAIEPLAQQRGAGKALLESIVAAATAAGVKRLSLFVSDFDNALPPILSHLGFQRGRSVARYALSGPPAALPLPRESEEPAGDGPLARVAPLVEALPVVHAEVSTDKLLFSQRPEVLEKLAADKLVAYVSSLPGAAPRAAAIYDRERKQLLALGGDAAQLGPLLCLLAIRQGVSTLEALAEGHPAEAALAAAGYARAAVRLEWWKDLG